MIRAATHGDVGEILKMYRLGLEELGETKFSESLMLDKVLSSYHVAPCFLLIKDDIIVGMAGLTIITLPWNGTASLADYMFYVQPEHRNIKDLSALVNKSKEFAEALGIPLRIQFATDAKYSVKERLFRMHNFEISSVVGTYNKEAA
jgi:hypothetical protein